MIVELADDDVAALIAKQPVTLGDVIVRWAANGGPGGVLHERTPTSAVPAPAAVPAPPDVRQRRRDAKAQVTGEPQFYMDAKFRGSCANGCGTRWEYRDRICRDATTKLCYCPPCGHDLFPHLIDPRA